MDAASRDSRLVQIGGWAALICGAALLVKVANIFLVEGANNPIQPALYLGAIAVATVAAAGVGARYGSSKAKKVAIGVATFVGFVFFLMMLSDAIGGLIDGVADVPAYVPDEAPIALAGIAWLIVGYKLRASTDR